MYIISINQVSICIYVQPIPFLVVPYSDKCHICVQLGMEFISYVFFPNTMLYPCSLEDCLIGRIANSFLKMSLSPGKTSDSREHEKMEQVV